MMISRTKMVALVSMSVITGIGLAVLAAAFWGLPGISTGAGVSAEVHGRDGGEADQYYTCPMHPSVVKDQPGACPVCGMDLINKTAGGDGMGPQKLAAMGRVSLSPTQRVLANVKTTVARSLDDPRAHGAGGQSSVPQTVSQIRAVGNVTFDETGLASIPSWVDGRIERLYVEETGAVIDKGQPIMKIYSPELLAAQEEYLVARSSSSRSLAGQVRKRLELLGMTAAQIADLKRSGKPRAYVTVSATTAGTITAMNVRQGQYVDEGDPLYEIADLSTVWVDAKVYETNLAAIEEGMNARVVVQTYPDEPMDGRVAFIHPVVASDTRTARVRVELDNAAHKLHPGMYATVFLQNTGDSSAENEPAKSAKPTVVVPKSAVIRGGKTNSVYVEVDPNVFERRRVNLGRATDEFLTVTSGVEAGEKVAYRGGFLLDSEVQLNSFGASTTDSADAAQAEDGADKGGQPGGPKDALPGAVQGSIEAADIPADGKKLDPMLPIEDVPEGIWACEMNGKSHWVQHDRGDGACPICGMQLERHKRSQ